MTEIDVADDDTLLMCSDGLTGMLADDEIASALTETADLADTAATLVKAANQAGGTDNVTVVLIRC